MNEATRFKLAIGLVILYCIEGIIKALLTAFPIEVVVGAQGAVAIYYFTVKTVDNVKAAKFSAPCPPAVNGK